MCPLLVPASKGKRLLFFSFFVAAAIDSTTEANKAPLSSLYSLDVYGNEPFSLQKLDTTTILNGFTKEKDKK